MEFLTTSEAADYVRLGERKLYELVTEGAIPGSKVTGKWLFPRHELDLWVLSGLARPAGMVAPDPPPIVGGGQDDLLEWSLRESGSGLASLAEGTARGVDRLQRGEVIAAAIHFHSDAMPAHSAPDANIAAVRAMTGLHDAVLVGLARREQGCCFRLAIRSSCAALPMLFPRAREWPSGSPARAHRCCSTNCWRAPAPRQRTCANWTRLVSPAPTLRPRSAAARRTAASRPAPSRNRPGSISSRCCGRISIC